MSTDPASSQEHIRTIQGNERRARRDGSVSELGQGSEGADKGPSIKDVGRVVVHNLNLFPTRKTSVKTDGWYASKAGQEEIERAREAHLFIGRR